MTAQPTSSSSQAPVPISAATPVGQPARSAADRGSDLRAFLGALLRLQCQLAPAEGGLVYLKPGASRKGGVAVTYHGERGPGEASEELDASVAEKLTAVALRACEGEGRPIVEPITIAGSRDLYATGATHTALATPLRAEHRLEGASVVLAPRTLKDQDAAMVRLGLSASRFEAFLWRQSALHETEQKVVLRETLELLDRAQQGSTARAMASVMCDEVRRRFGCTRVSIGLIKGDRVRVVAISGADDLDSHAPAVEAIEGVMEEAALQDAEVIYPVPEADEREPRLRRVIHEHARLSEAFGPSSIVSLPLRLDGDLVGAMVLERDQTDPFPPGSLTLLRLVAEFVGPAVYTRRLADRRSLQVARDDLLDLGAGIVGPRHTAKKLVALVVIVVLAALAFVPIPARVAAPMELRASVSRAIVPPFAGYLDRSLVRPGDRVEIGDLLAVMQTDELVMSLAEAEARRETLAARLDNAMARGERSQSRQVQAEIDEIDASANLIRERLKASELRAPIAGVVSQGDLERLAGAPVDASQVLLEIVGEETTAIIEVSERDADRIAMGQSGWISSRGSPGQKIPVRVSRINPVAQLRESRSVYLVEAEIQASDEALAASLRPGMTGNARLRAGWSTGLWELSRPVIDAIRLRLWW